jgi:CO/xanthine dehydrogenase FAD-binding subunit
LRLGALVTHDEIVANRVIRERFTALADASAIVGSHATRAHGTIGGNVMNASPAMDTGGPLLCFGASADLRSASRERALPLEELWTGPGETAADPRELLVRVDVPAPAPTTGSAYVRLEYRRQMEIAVVGVTAVVRLDAGSVSDARVAITALAPTIRRVAEAEAALIDSDGGEEAIGAAARAAASGSSPITDVRSSAEYRSAMANVIARRAIVVALARARGEHVPIPASASTYASVGGTST